MQRILKKSPTFPKKRLVAIAALPQWPHFHNGLASPPLHFVINKSTNYTLLHFHIQYIWATVTVDYRAGLTKWLKGRIFGLNMFKIGDS
jgi:hypothetical protein